MRWLTGGSVLGAAGAQPNASAHQKFGPGLVSSRSATVTDRVIFSVGRRAPVSSPPQQREVRRSAERQPASEHAMTGEGNVSLGQFSTVTPSRLVWSSRVETLARLGRDLIRTAADAPGVLLENLTAAPQANLIVLDDIFPQALSSFRVAEFNEYLSRLPGSRVHTTASSFAALGEKRRFTCVRAEYEQTYPALAGRTRRFHPWRRLEAAGAYLVFIANAAQFLPILERDRLPFVFTLYPGGGFFLDDPASDAQLRRVCSSRWFRGVIVTQRITRDYLVDRGLCDASQIHFVYGGVFPVERLQSRLPVRCIYGAGKPTFDVCFVAHRYMKGGIDKGYDRFVAAARRLYCRYPDMHFHAVGPWTPADQDVSAIRDRFHFHGSRPTSFFPGFYSRMDAILSPNVPFVLRKGAFDGFPTGACMEAGLCGVPVVCTDELGLNTEFRHGEDIMLIEPTTESCVGAVAELREDHAKWSRISAATTSSFSRVFALEAQMKPRLDLLQNAFHLSRATWD